MVRPSDPLPVGNRRAVVRGYRLILTRLAQGAFAGEGLRRCPRRVIFMHIPKTAGSTATGYFKQRLGSSWRGQALTVSDAAGADERLCTLARGARFVGGHFGAGTLGVLRDGAYAFTVLRDPLSRLVSAWRFFQSHRRAELNLPFATLDAALASRDPGVITAFDNVILRHLAGALDRPGPLAEDPEADHLLARAQAELAGLDRVIWQDDFEAEFAAMLGDLGLPPAPAGARRNVTADPARRGRARALPPVPPAETLAHIAAPWTALDDALIRRWRVGACPGRRVTASPGPQTGCS